MTEATAISPNSAPAIERPAPSETPVQGERFFLLLAIFIGVFSGLAVVCFRITIEFLRIQLFGSSLTPAFPRILLAPALTGLVIALLVMLVFPRVRGSGVNQTKSALYVDDGYIPFRTAIGNFICSALAIGSGQSFGPEDPALRVRAASARCAGPTAQWRPPPRATRCRAGTCRRRRTRCHRAAGWR